MHYFWCLLNKLEGWCTWGTYPFAHRTMTGCVFGIHFDIQLATQAYKDNTRQFHLLFCDKNLEALEAHYNKYKDLYKGSAEWDAGMPVLLHRLRVLGK